MAGRKPIEDRLQPGCPTPVRCRGCARRLTGAAYVGGLCGARLRNGTTCDGTFETIPLYRPDPAADPTDTLYEPHVLGMVMRFPTPPDIRKAIFLLQDLHAAYVRLHDDRVEGAADRQREALLERRLRALAEVTLDVNERIPHDDDCYSRGAVIDGKLSADGQPRRVDHGNLPADHRERLCDCSKREMGDAVRALLEGI